MEEISGDIAKQTATLDKLNMMNNEKARRITEFEGYFGRKKGSSRVMNANMAS